VIENPPCLVPASRRSKRKLADTHALSRDAHAGAVRGVVILLVMAGPDPAIHVFLLQLSKTWMPGTGPGMTISFGRIWSQPVS
jgi:hypothetical protein